MNMIYRTNDFAEDPLYYRIDVLIIMITTKTKVVIIPLYRTALTSRTHDSWRHNDRVLSMGRFHCRKWLGISCRAY